MAPESQDQRVGVSGSAAVIDNVLRAMSFRTNKSTHLAAATLLLTISGREGEGGVKRSERKDRRWKWRSRMSLSRVKILVEIPAD